MISKASVHDITPINALVNSAYRGESSKKGWTTEAHLLEGVRTDEVTLKTMLENQDAVLLKYENEQGVLKGCVYLEKQGHQLYLGMLTVSPELQNSGIGKQLLNASEAYAQQQGLSSVMMSVISVRAELIAWYERHGYKQTGATKPFPMHDSRFGLPKQHLEFLILEKRFT